MDHKMNDQQTTLLVHRHLRIAWWSLLFFLTLGIVLEILHAFKVGWYLDVTNDTRRLMWTLAHAHGTLLSFIHIALGVTIKSTPSIPAYWVKRASPCLTGATILLPGGFFFGGLFIYQGDPGLGILLVPVGAVMLFISVGSVVRGLSKARQPSDGSRQRDTEFAHDMIKKKRKK